MADAYQNYLAAMRDPWRGWWITWPLSQRVRLGDVFDTSGGTLRAAGDLASRAVQFNRAREAPPSSFTYDSAGSVSIRFKAAGDIPGGFSVLARADAGALVEFGTESSVLVVYTRLTQGGFSDVPAVAADLARLYWDGRWTAELVAVSEVVSVAGGTVLVARQLGASAELRVEATAGPGPGALTLADLAGNVSFARTANLGLRWAGEKITPFYRVVRLRKTWRDKIKVAYGSPQPGRGLAAEPVPPLVLEEARDDPDAVIESSATDEQPLADSEGTSSAGDGS